MQGSTPFASQPTAFQHDPADCAEQAPARFFKVAIGLESSEDEFGILEDGRCNTGVFQQPTEPPTRTGFCLQRTAAAACGHQLYHPVSSRQLRGPGCCSVRIWSLSLPRVRVMRVLVRMRAWEREERRGGAPCAAPWVWEVDFRMGAPCVVPLQSRVLEEEPVLRCKSWVAAARTEAHGRVPWRAGLCWLKLDRAEHAHV